MTRRLLGLLAVFVATSFACIVPAASPPASPGQADVGATDAASTSTPSSPRAFGAVRHRGKYALVVPAPAALGPMRKEGDRYVASWGARLATLTLDPPLHDALTTDLRLGRPQWGATVILDVKTGAILALAEASEREPGVPGAATRPLGKAASIFKIVTASALVRAGVPLSTEVCGSGGKTRLKPQNVAADFRTGGRCVRFEDVVPMSQNVGMAKLAARFLTPATLESEAARFGFGRDFTVDLPVERSTALVPKDDAFAFATSAAGFGDVYLTALHGAALAALVGNGGVLVPPHLVESVEGDAMPQHPPERVLDEQHAAVLQAMMAAAVSHGTASRAFHGGRWSPYGRHPQIDVPVAGKTGSLTDRDADLDTTWFVGTAPVHDPKIAIATVVINDEWIWHVRALDVATRAVATYFRLHPENARVDEPVAAGPSPQASR